MSETNWVIALKEWLRTGYPPATVHIDEPGPPPARGWGAIVRIEDIGLCLVIGFDPSEMCATICTPEELDEHWALDESCTTYEDLERTTSGYITRAYDDPQGLLEAAKEQANAVWRQGARIRGEYF